MLEILVIVLLVGGLVLLARPLLARRGRGGPRGDVAQGTLLITGLSPRPDGAQGEQFVTITGVISGPTVDEHEVYTRMVVDAAQWPTMGQLIPVVYSARNPDSWRFAPPPPVAPPAAPPV